jgi:hypothetical protein
MRTGLRATIAGLAALVTVLAGGAAAAAPSDALLAVSGTARWTDPATGRIVVAVDDTVTGAALARLSGSVGRLGGRLIHEPGVRTRRIAGGDPFFTGPGFRCTIGFNARRATDVFFLTAAHCVGAVGGPVYADAAAAVPLGVVTARDDSRDYALVRYTDTTLPKPSAVSLYNGTYRPITAVSPGTVGQAVQRAGPVSGVRTGRITALNVTVQFAGGAVTGLIRTNVCAEPGDSGGPLFAANTAIGMTVGGSGNCATGGTTYFSSASRAMSRYAVSVY